VEELLQAPGAEEGGLPPYITWISPPGYRKKNKSRALWTVLRKDQYRMDGDRIILQGLGAVGWIEVKYKDPIHLRGERGGSRYATTTIERSGTPT
jgi:putative transposase